MEEQKKTHFFLSIEENRKFYNKNLYIKMTKDTIGTHVNFLKSFP